MRLNEFSSPLNKYLVTVKVNGTLVKTLIHAESQSEARLLLGKMFGKDNVQSINSISTNESKTTISLNLQEAVNADDLVSLWQIVSQNVFAAFEKERRKQEQAFKQRKKPKAAPKAKKQPKLSAPPVASKQKPTKTDKSAILTKQQKSAQQTQKPQVLPKVFSNTQKSNLATPQTPTTSNSIHSPQGVAKTRSERVTHDPNSVANIQRQLYPLANNDVVKRLTS